MVRHLCRINLRNITLGLLLALTTASSFAQENIKHLYRVSIDKNTNKALVEAQLYLEGNQLSLFNVNPMPGYPNGQADFIEKIQVRDSKGQILPVQNKGEGDYELAGNQLVNLSYEVRLEHDKLNWPAGNEEVLYHTEEGIMLTGFSLFLAPSEKMTGDIKVEFRLPEGWRANTALEHLTKESTSSKPVFIAHTRRELLSNALFFGTAQAEQFEAGGLQLSLVLGKRYWPQRAMFKQLLTKQLQTYLDLFGNKPLAPRYLIIINQGDSGDGGAFSSSFSQFLRGDAELQTRPIWGRVLAHELLHFWNGLSLIPSSDQEEWFKEGVTDYLTIMTMSRNKLIDKNYLQQWLENLSRGQMVARRAQGIQDSVRDAAKNKHQNWLLVYGGGSIAGLALDIELRRASNEKIGIQEFMQAVYAEFAKPGKSYQLSDLQRIAQQLTGKNFDIIFQQLVQSKTAIDLQPSFSALGLRLEQYLLLEHTLLKDLKAKPSDQKRFQSIFGQAF